MTLATSSALRVNTPEAFRSSCFRNLVRCLAACSLVITLGVTRTAPAQVAPEFVTSAVIPSFFSGPLTGAGIDPSNPNGFGFGFPNGYTPLEIVDWNGDGHLDIVTASETIGAVLILQGNGDGQFTSLELGWGGVTPVAVVAADFNEDGTPDLAVCNGSAGTVSLVMSTPTSYNISAITTGSKPIRAYAADVNENGHLDLVVVDEIDSTVGLLPGIGNGSFGPQQVSFIEIDDSLEAVAIEDVNKDGHLDLVVPCPLLDMVAVLVANAPGLFNAPLVYPVGHNPGPVAVEDFDGDGNRDVLIPNRDESSLSLLRGVGDGTFLAPETITSPDNPVLARAIRNRAAKSFGAYPHADQPSLSVVSTLDPQVTPSAQVIQTLNDVDWVESADFNNDGLGDLAVVSFDEGIVQVFLQKPGQFLRGDVNGDERLTIGDFVTFLDALVASKPLECIDRADANDDGEINLADPVRILERLFLGSAALPAPNFQCGEDMTPDMLPPCFAEQGCAD